MTIKARTATVIASLALGIALTLGLAQPAGASSYVTHDESRMIELVNGVRAKKGLAKLARVSGLVSMAREQADRMEAKGTIFHNTDLGGDIASRGIQWLRVGENVGMGPNLDLIHQALLDSPKHYENIVRSDYNSVGIGVVDGDDGLRYVVQVFANVKGSPAPAPAPAAAKPAPAPVAAAAQAPASAAPVRTATAAPATPKPVLAPTADLNALTGGYVNPIELPRSDQGKQDAQAASASESGFGDLIEILAFWS